MSEPTTSDDLLTLALQTLDEQDTGAVVELLAQHPAVLAAPVYQRLQSHLYWKCKALPAMVAVSRAGIQRCLSSDPSLRSTGKAIAYNLASFTWPGWDEKGVTITPADLVAGLDAAVLNLCLAEELDKPPKARATAFWALGAQQLAAGQHRLAADSFARGKEHADRAAEPALSGMLDAYAKMASLLDRPDDAEAVTQFDQAVSALRKLDTDEGPEFAAQVVAARDVFLRRLPTSSDAATLLDA